MSDKSSGETSGVGLGAQAAKASGKGKGIAAHSSAQQWESICDDITSSYKAGEDIMALQRFEELQAMTELDTFLQNSDLSCAALEKIEFCWGRALLSAKRIARGDDDDGEHASSIVDSFEERFQRRSDYLRVLAITADGPLDVLRVYQLLEEHVSPEAVTAALHHFPALNGDETKKLLEFLKSNDVPITQKIAEQLEKNFVVRMKTEDAEDVLREMRAAGVEPVSSRPYSFIFMKSAPFKYMSPIEYYEDMLDRGITPENSTFRILSKHTQYIGYVNQHFNTLAWGKSTPGRRREEEERGGTQAFFATRLEELAKANPDTPLDEALKVLRRMHVEGTPLTNGSPVLGVLLTQFCRQDKIEDTEKVLRAASEYGCRPTCVTLQKILKSTGSGRFDQAELVLQRISDAGESIQVDCVDLLRHFVLGSMRSKAVRVFRAFVVQAHRDINQQIPFGIASMAMKLGPFGWALGLLAILIASVDKPLGRGVQARLRYTANENRFKDVLAVLDRCEWKRERLLLAPELQEPRSNGNEKGWPTWLSAMHIALAEVDVGKEVMQSFKTMLTSEIEKAKRHKNGAG